ncbi:Cytochrome c [Novipirellula galeiformis]|uniref:Cytochrome c n=1 Tax=Novipirellula galeiformis TaxID=2528004 RepID=A0A5C6BY05_9BACT|nr:PVC-type heme-binding CxxCH protein [Novipirellula galeiformis]TWU17220.1 Cytochrome c [Novipirellula galeiformis]
MKCFPIMIRWRFSSVIPLAFLALSVHAEQPAEVPAKTAVDRASVDAAKHTPENSAKQLKVREGLEVRLAAAEPDVVDPVSAAWSTDGKLWVVEMSDYPMPKPGQTERHGRIRVLSDRDASGRFKSSVTFADGLDFATGILPWQNGAIVTLAGEIVYLRDDNGDGQADTREVWFKGFTTGNEQLRANHPRLGPDGWVYVANGLRGGEIIAVDPRFRASKTPLKLQGRDFVFDPHGGEWGTVSGNSQHGLTIDGFNRRFGCSNRNPAIESVLSADVIDRDPFLTPGDAIADVGKSGFNSEVHPISNAWTTSNLHAGQFSAACGVTAPGWAIDDTSEWLLVCEPTGSLVQRQRMHWGNGTWKSEREANEAEWLASSDDWFRAVDLVPDVDGGVLVVDMVRAVIEHPHWAPIELQNRPDTWDGKELGRIWQVHVPNKQIKSVAVRDDASALEAIVSEDLLSRMLASDHLLAHYSPAAPPQANVIDSLARLLSDSAVAGESKARIAMLLNRWGALTPTQHASLLGEQDDRVRALAIKMRQGNRFDGNPVSSTAMLFSAFDDSALIVRQAALETLVASVDASELNDAKISQLVSLAIRDREAPWVLKLLTALPNEFASELLSASLPTPQSRATAVIPTSVFEGWMRRVSAKDPQRATELLVNWLSEAMPTGAAADQATQALVMQMAAAWSKGGGAKGTTSLSKEAADRITALDSLAASIAINDKHAVGTRLDAIEWCRKQPEFATELRALVDKAVDTTVRAAAYRVLMQRDTEWTKQQVLDQAESISPTDRVAVVTAVRGSVQTATWLLTEIGQGNLPRTFVDPSSMDWFRRHSDADLAKLGRETFAPAGDVLEVLREYESAAKEIETADVVQGKALFAQHCANCHRIDEVGHVVGPDISDSRTKTPEALLAAILDPSAAIDASYASYSILTVDGEAVSGLLAGESSDSVTLVIPGGHTRRFEREDIEIFRASSVSLMPEGMQRVMNVEQMRNLIGYLKRWRY